jgi:diacylglycerol kinase (ATP)
MYYYIVNPAAGGGRINKIQDRLQERLKKLGILGDFVKSTGPGDVARLAQLAINKGYKTIVAVGGDGTINEVMNVILDKDRVALGIIPTGTTNDLAYALGIHDWYQATGILSSRKIEEVELGQIGERFFVTSATVGFEPKVSQIKRLSKGNIFDRTRFGVRVLREASSYKPIHAHLKFDDNYEVEADIFNIIISNVNFSPLGKTTGSNLLNTVVMTKIPGSKAFKYGYFNDSSSVDLPKISVFHSKNIKIATKEPAEIAADGQVLGHTPTEIRISDRKLRVIVSRKRKI